MQPLTSVQLKKLEKLAKVGDIGIADELNALEGKIEALEAIVPSLREARDGEKGEKGDMGDRGEKGDKGERGADGRDGVDGKDGKDGINGRDGKDGRDGVDGKDGRDGKDGEMGMVDEATIAYLEDEVKKAKLDTDAFNRALGIVDQRTSFSINKASNLERDKITGVGVHTITVSSTAPANPTSGDIWIDTDAEETGFEIAVWTTETRPSTPTNGLVGYNYTTKELEVYDSNLGDWIQFFGYDKDDGHWDDLRFPATAINPPGAARDPTRNTSDGTLEFSASATNVIAGVAQMPHAWLRGSTIRPHIHWQPTTTGSGNVLWKFEYDIASVNSNFAGTYTPMEQLDGADGIVNKHQILGFGDVTMTDKSESCIIKWLLSRVGGDASDTYAGAAKLLEFDIHYQVGKYGTPDEFPVL